MSWYLSYNWNLATKIEIKNNQATHILIKNNADETYRTKFKTHDIHLKHSSS